MRGVREIMKQALSFFDQKFLDFLAYRGDGDLSVMIKAACFFGVMTFAMASISVFVVVSLVISGMKILFIAWSALAVLCTASFIFLLRASILLVGFKGTIDEGKRLLRQSSVVLSKLSSSDRLKSSIVSVVYERLYAFKADIEDIQEEIDSYNEIQEQSIREYIFESSAKINEMTREIWYVANEFIARFNEYKNLCDKACFLETLLALLPIYKACDVDAEFLKVDCLNEEAMDYLRLFRKYELSIKDADSRDCLMPEKPEILTSELAVYNIERIIAHVQKYYPGLIRSLYID